MSNYTKGPWDYDWYQDHVSFSDNGVHSDYFMRVEFCESVDDSDWDGNGQAPEAIANADLIAAAPDLLEALIAIEQASAGEIVWEDCNSMEETIEKARLIARKAIAKAKGEAI